MHELDSRVTELEDITVANIVASGDFDIELDLAAVAAAPEFAECEWIEDVEHSRRRGNRLLIDFTEGDSLGILAPTGVYVITGPDTYEELYKSKDQLFNALKYADVVDDPIENFEIQNVVCTADLDFEVTLEALAIGLGLENTEYEPEQFPGLVYRPGSESCTILVFATGKVVITGVVHPDTAQEEYDNLKERMNEILSTSV
jgi:transcription initiation factor TFIID TATA-box-binding protein